MSRRLAVWLGCWLMLATGCSPPANQPAADPPKEDSVTVDADPLSDGKPGPGSSPNIVLVLLDDFSMDLVPAMKSFRRMAQAGATYDQSYVVDSLCCVSRASLMTGQYPHQTGVLTNTHNPLHPETPLGGSKAFFEFGNDVRSVNLSLQKAGYTTGFVGKYLNEYEAYDGVVPPAPIGWSDFRVVFGDGYDGWGFHATETTKLGTPKSLAEVKLRNYPTPAQSTSGRDKDAVYAGNVTSDLALDFLTDRQNDQAPYYLEVAPYAPHSRVEPAGAWPKEPYFPAAFRDRPRPSNPAGNCGAVPCDELTVGSLAGFGPQSYASDRSAPQREDGTPVESWRWNKDVSVEEAERTLRNRARMAQSADRMIRQILNTVDDNTYVIVTSDNGFHIGQFGTIEGKQTPYDTDVRVPLYVVGPGVAPGTRSEFVNTLDVASTLEDLAGIKSPRYRSGESIVPTLTNSAKVRRDAVFFEHNLNPPSPDDPDALAGLGISPVPSFIGIRTETELLARFDIDPDWQGEDFAWEFYDYTSQPWERTNQFSDPAYADQVALLRTRLEAFDACRTIQGGSAVPRECRRLSRR